MNTQQAASAAQPGDGNMNSETQSTDGSSAEERVVHELGLLNERALALNDRALAFVRERPAACLVGAVALGFIVGKIASRY